jgi:iron complex transport system substrate-binding protein
LEQVELLDSDVLVILANDGDPEDLPGYTDLPAVTSGAVSEMAFGTVVGLNTPTPLSVPFVLDELLPTLEAAAAS